MKTYGGMMYRATFLTLALVPYPLDRVGPRTGLDDVKKNLVTTRT
jgi:hypothetical protein